MAEVEWTLAAERDVNDIHRFIAERSRDNADRVIARLRQAAERLADFPESGRAVPESRRPNNREVIVPPYRVVYHYDSGSSRVVILAVFHGSRPIPPLDDLI